MYYLEKLFFGKFKEASAEIKKGRGSFLKAAAALVF
jgi:hypothetical protein